jgi:ATP-dependent Clp protease ATP-binding subunit ClpB
MPSYLDRYDDSAREALLLTNQVSLVSGRKYLETFHLLLGVLSTKQNVVGQALKDNGLPVTAIENMAKKLFANKTRTASSTQIVPTQDFRDVVEILALEEATKLGSEKVSVNHLFLALLRDPGKVTTDVFNLLNIDQELIRQQVITRLNNK